MFIGSGSTSAEVDVVDVNLYSFVTHFALPVLATLWVTLVIWSYIYYRRKLRPAILKLQETPEGRKQLVKALFPPRFNRD